MPGRSFRGFEKGRSNKPLRAYLDTCILSGLVRNDLSLEESEAMVALLSSPSKVIEFVTSNVALSEIEQIPLEHRIPHLAIYHLLGKVHALPEPSITRLAPWGGPRSNPDRWLWMQIGDILPDGKDVEHLYQVVKNKVEYFVTVDEATILKHKAILASKVGVWVVRPGDLLRLVRSDE